MRFGVYGSTSKYQKAARLLSETGGCVLVGRCEPEAQATDDAILLLLDRDPLHDAALDDPAHAVDAVGRVVGPASV